ncbi:unnamed protein product [Macrosiphum euphorbiae]|uniref:C2H2-type domain-containing protein n=1 Tax=Macrosiphum euphorbiae TaxID=13131 RepID=A0AAV0XX50_9HEMI|nr:unnamed protein product [Macrosiphum euphorbiae]
MPKHPKKKLSCPLTMVRYYCDILDYPTTYIWVCKICLRMILSEEAVSNHLNNCSKKHRQSNQAPPIPTKKNEDLSYICEYCGRVFSRRVKLKKHHIDVHEKSSSLY